MTRLRCGKKCGQREKRKPFGRRTYARRLAYEALEDRRLLAVAITEQAQVEIESTLSPSPDPGGLGANPPIDDIIQLAFGENGRVYTNSFAVTAGGEATDIRSVGIVRLDNMSQVDNSDFNSLRRNGNRVVAVFGVQGFVFEPNNARFTEGTMWFYEVPGGGNPTFGDPATFNPANLIEVSRYVLKAQALGGPGPEPVAGVGVGGERADLVPGVPGFSQQIIPIPAEEIDVSGVETAIGAAGDGDFIFIEDPRLPNNPFIDLSYVDFDGNQVEPKGRPDLGLTPLPNIEGLHAITTQFTLNATALPNADNPDMGFGTATNAAQRATLNDIAMAAFADPFADFGSGGNSDWRPLVDEGDFLASLSASAHPISCAEPAVGEGLTPGFWKTHSEHGPAPLAGWPETGFDPDDSYEDIFDVDVPGSPTLLDALNAEGGGLNALLRHSTAALLNAAHPNIDYDLTVAEVLALTKAAIESGDPDQIESLKDQFDALNNQGADLSV